MRKQKLTSYVSGLVAAGSILACASVSAETDVYVNAGNPLGAFADHGNAEVGDTITLASADQLTVKSFAFEYFLSQKSGNETAQVFFRAMDGINGTPGSILFSSNVFPLELGQQQAFDATLNVPVTQTFTWSVLFQGIEAGEKAGLIFNNPPSVGSSGDFYWVSPSDPLNPNSGFGRFESGQVDNFAAKVTAVPEPSTWAMLVGGLAWVGFLGYRRKA